MMKRFPFHALFLLTALVLPFMAGCGARSQSEWPAEGKPRVVVSFAPIYCFVASVAGADAHVKNVMTNTGPHNFDPTGEDARNLRDANLFFINGLDLDNRAAAALQKGANNPGLKVIDLGGTIPEAQLLEGVCHHNHGTDEPHEHGIDPHVWLGPSRAIVMVQGIRDALKQADPEHAANYDRRAAEYVAQLEKLKADGLALLKDKTQRKLVTFHESMNYFADEFNLAVLDVVQQTPGTEPNPDDLEKLIGKCVRNEVGIVAVEPQYSHNLSARTILDELKHKGLKSAAFVEFDPLETVPAAELTPQWYEAKMRQNLSNLAKALP